MTTWAQFEAVAPELAIEGRRLIHRGDAGEMLLATVRDDEPPRIHPVNVAIVDGRLFAFILRSAKRRTWSATAGTRSTRTWIRHRRASSRSGDTRRSSSPRSPGRRPRRNRRSRSTTATPSSSSRSRPPCSAFGRPRTTGHRGIRAGPLRRRSGRGDRAAGRTCATRGDDRPTGTARGAEWTSRRRGPGRRVEEPSDRT